MRSVIFDKALYIAGCWLLNDNEASASLEFGTMLGRRSPNTKISSLMKALSLFSIVLLSTRTFIFRYAYPDPFSQDDKHGLPLCVAPIRC